MKQFILSLVWILSLSLTHAQLVPIANETFEGSLSGWTITPASSWHADTNLYVSGHTSYRGIVPIGNNPGDTSIITSPVYNLTSYAYAWLQFSQICKVSASDICKIEYKEIYSGSSWQAVPTSAYKGYGVYTNALFNHVSYPEWQASDSLAVPTNSWWKTENFNISNEVSYASVQFRFKITRGSALGSYFVYGWLIDNFKLIASNNPITPPEVAITSTYGDTVFNTGPFIIEAKVAARTPAPILAPKLYYAATYNNVTTYDSIVMTPIAGDTIWTATIPQHLYGTSIDYSVVGIDSVGNTNTDQKGMFLKRLSGGGITGNVIVGNGTIFDAYAPINRFYDYSWSRILYLGSELSPNATGGLISKLAWQVATTCTSGTNQTCYFKEVTDNTISNVAYINPVSAGATLVWSGTYNLTTTGWSEVTLQTPFVLTPGKNLLIYWENRDGNYVSPYSEFYYTTTSNYMTLYDYDDGIFPAYLTPYNGGLDYARPNVRFYLTALGGDDTNSVAMHNIDSPQDTVFADPVNQLPVVVTIKNKGMGFLDSCYINWTLNGIPQLPVTWRGHLPEDFNAQDTIGYYSPKAGGFDTLVIWTSSPNSAYDSTTFDDTLNIISYGQSGLNMAFVSNIPDTVFNSGPFAMKALISSRTSTPVPTPINLYVKYTYNAVNTYDTIIMTYLGNDTFSAVIPQHMFGTGVQYAIYVTDSFGNIVSIQDNFYIKRLSGGGVTGYVIVGNGTNYDSYLPMNRYYDYSWSRMLYLASEINPASGGGLITKLAWQLYSTMANATNQSCYFQEVTDNTISNVAYINPVSAGATLVWSGTYDLSITGWSEVTLQTPFTLTPGKNLLIYWENKDGNYDSPYTEFYYTTTPNIMSAYDYDDYIFPNYSTPNNGGLSYDRANARFYIVSLGNDDSNSVALHNINNPTLGTMGGSQAVNVTIKNKGIKYLDSCYLNWTVNGVLQTPVVYRGHLPEDFNDTITLGYYTQRYLNNDTIVVWVSMPNGLIDSVINDDTLEIISYGCYGPVSGDFIIGNGAGADAASIMEAYYVGSRCGVNGNITLKLQNGVYVENVILDDLESILGNYTLTITSLSGNKDSVVIRPVSGDALTLFNSANVSIYHITFDAVTGNYAVNISGNAKNILFNDCNFYANQSSTAFSQGGLYQLSNSNTVTNLTVKNSIFNGGYFGVFLDNNSTAMAQNVTMDSNIFTNQYYFGIYYSYVNAISTSFNTIKSRSINNSDDWCGMFLEELHNGGKVIGNKIYSNNLSIYGYLFGIYTDYVDSAMIANNEIYFHTDASDVFGIFINYPIGVSYVHNTVLITGSPYNNSTIYWSIFMDSTYNAKIKNNIFVANGGTTSYAIYLDGSYSSTYAQYYDIDYNNYYSSGSLGYVSWSNQLLLSDWQYNVTSDVNSTDLLPDFIDSTVNLKLASYNGLSCPSYPGVTTDIEGNIRTTFTTMGAYSIPIFDGYNLEVSELVSPQNINDIQCLDDFANVKVIVKNSGTQNYFFNTSPVTLHLVVSGALNFQKDTIINVGSLLRTASDTFELTSLMPIHISGNYQISVFLSSSLDTVYLDDTLKTNYVVNKVSLPYDVDFSTTPVEFIFKQITGTVNWQVVSGTGVSPVIAPVYGTGRLEFASSNGIGSISQAIINGIDLRGNDHPSLEFWYAHDASSTNHDLVVVKVSTNGGASYQTLQTINRYNSAYAIPGWEHYVIDLSSFNQAACLSLIFEASSFGGANQSIDRIRIFANKDITVSLLNPKVQNLKACNLTNNNLEFVVENLTAQTIDFNTDTSRFYVEITGAATLSFTQPIAGQLQSFGKDTLLLSNQFDLSTNGIYHIKAYIHAVDSNQNNDTVYTSILINPDLSIKDLTGVDAVKCKRIGDSVYVSVKIVNTGNLAVDQIPLRLQINGGNDITETVNHYLASGDSIVYAFTKAYVVPTVSDIQPHYTLRLKSELPCDVNASNNEINLLACVNLADLVDLSIQSINKPLPSVCDSGLSVIKVSVTLANLGDNDISSAVINVKVDSAGHAWASFSETTDTITAKGSLLHVCTNTYVVPNFSGNYTVKVYLDSITADEKLSNDTATVTACAIYKNIVGIDLINKIDWSLGQNIPNPVTAITQIPYSIPQQGSIHFSVMTITGQVLYTKTIQSMAGDYSITFDTQSLADGIYYYNMEYEGQRIVRKMTIQR